MTHFVQLEDCVAEITFNAVKPYECPEAIFTADEIRRKFREKCEKSPDTYISHTREQEILEEYVSALPAMRFILQPKVELIRFLQRSYTEEAFLLGSTCFGKLNKAIEELPFAVCEADEEEDTPRQAIRYILRLRDRW